MIKNRVSSLRSQSVGIDKQLLIVVLVLVVFGVVMVADASVVDATKTFGDRLYYAKRQLFWMVLGLASMFLFSRIDYKLLKRIALPAFFGSLVLLVLPLIPGVGSVIHGSRRWIEAGPLVVQPSEIIKLTLCIYLPSLLSPKKKLPPFIFAVLIPFFLIMLEPDLGTAGIIVATSLFIFFASGAPIWYFLSIIPIGGLLGSIFILTSPYRKERLLTFLSPTSDPLGSSYHIRQILIALGSGGIFGVGIGQSRQKYLFLPEPATDSILAVIGEELGLIGTSAILLVFVFIIWRGLSIAIRTKDMFGKLLAIGLTSLIGVQALVNMSAMVALVPLTGVPLPFLSYGGSSLVVSLTAVGILLNISGQRES